MRIVMYSASFPPGQGGIETHVVNLSRALVEQGHQVKVVTVRRDGVRPDHTADAGLDVYRIPTLPVPHTRDLQYALRSAACFAALRRRWQADVIHYHTLGLETYSAWLVRRLIPVVYTCHESRFLILASSARNTRRLRLAVAPFRYVIAPSCELLEAARRFGVDPRHSTYIPNAVDPCAFSPGRPTVDIRARHGVPSTSTVVICPRRLVPKNGVDYLLKGLQPVMARRAGLWLMIAGDGPERETLRKLATDLAIDQRTVFCGGIPNQHMSDYYRAADIAALPSLMEATSIAGLEAMATGLPLVATNVGGIPALVDDGNTGFLVPPRDPAALGDAVERIAESVDLRRTLGDAGRRRVESEFSWPTAARRTAAVYDSVVGAK